MPTTTTHRPPPPAAPAEDARTRSEAALFRAEVVEGHQGRWLGTVLLVPKASHGLVMLFALLASAGVLALLVFAEYTRKARVNGWLLPEQGVVRIAAPQAGVLLQLQAREGMEVKHGQILAVLSTEIQSQELGAIRSEVLRRLRNRRDSMAAGRQQQELLFSRQMDDRSSRLAALHREQSLLDQEFATQRARLALAEQGLERQRLLFGGRLVPWDRLQGAQEDKLRQDLSSQTLERTRINLARERMALEAELREMPLKHQLQLAEIDRGVAALEQEVAEAEARRQFVVTAPQDGIVTAIQAEAGSTVTTAVPLLSIVPASSRLEAHLFGPSSAIGFVKAEQRVLLRYQAFPYQKFGQYEGRVVSVSRSAISPAELSQQLAGVKSLFDGNAPVYRITVALASQTANAYGERVPLQPGMQLEADVLMERRRLIEWVLDPLFTLTGRWHR